MCDSVRQKLGHTNRQAKAYLYLRPIITPHEVEFPFTIQTGTIHPSEAWNK